MNTKYLDSDAMIALRPLELLHVLLHNIHVHQRDHHFPPLSLSPPPALSDSPSLQHSQDDYTLRLYTPSQRKGVKRLGFPSRNSTCILQVIVTRMAGKLTVPEIALENGANFHAGFQSNQEWVNGPTQQPQSTHQQDGPQKTMVVFNDDRSDIYDWQLMVVFDAKEVFSCNKEGLWRLLVRMTFYVCFVLSLNFIVLFL